MAKYVFDGNHSILLKNSPGSTGFMIPSQRVDSIVEGFEHRYYGVQLLFGQWWKSSRSTGYVHGESVLKPQLPTDVRVSSSGEIGVFRRVSVERWYRNFKDIGNPAVVDHPDVCVGASFRSVSWRATECHAGDRSFFQYPQAVVQSDLQGLVWL